jgi:glutamine synthetase
LTLQNRNGADRADAASRLRWYAYFMVLRDFGRGEVAIDRRDAAIEYAIDETRRADLRLVRFLYCDYGSVVRGKATHAEHLRHRLNEGIALVMGQTAMNGLDELQAVEGMTAVGEVRIVPDPESFRILPYVPKTAGMMSDLQRLNGQPWAACPRWFLKRMLAKAASKNIRVETVLENEFFLARPENGVWQPADRSRCFSTAGMDLQAEFTIDLIEALTAQEIYLEQALPEYGQGQQEISIRHAEALQAADDQIRVRETVKNIARKHEMKATFAAKPWPDQIGSGAHCHLSIWDTTNGENLFFDPGKPYGLSDLGRNWVGGILEHLPALVAITCPTVNSYRRLEPHAWASSYVCWGFDNREAAVRVPSSFRGRERATTNIELKTVDNTCNPYLAIGAIIAAGLDGIERHLDPGPDLDVDPGLLSGREREQRGMARLPTSLDEALEHLKQDSVLLDALGETLATAYIAVRHSEAVSYGKMPIDQEYREHFERF